MMTLLTRILTGLLVTLAFGSAASAEIVTYMVEFGTDDGMGGFTPVAGPVSQGTVIDWRVTATVTDADAANFGIAATFLNVTDSLGDTVNPATIDPAFNANFYNSIQPGTPIPGSLVEFGAIKFTEGQFGSGQVASGADPVAPVTIATGSYTLSTVGTHDFTLTAGSENRYFSAMGQSIAGAPTFDMIIFVNDSIVVTAGVPEPGSMLLASTLLFPGLIAARRRRRRSANQAA